MENAVVDKWSETDEVPPRCPRCRGLLRPDVVWFNEPLPEEAIERAIAASGGCDVFLCIGTSNQVYPAASLPMHALESGAIVIEINLPTGHAGERRGGSGNKGAVSNRRFATSRCGVRARSA